MDVTFATEFAQEWINAWNSHDLDRILSHYSEDFEMQSPFITQLTDHASGTLKGKTEIRSYWSKSLQKYPDLCFRLIEVLFSVDTICIYFHSKLNLRAMEWLRFDHSRHVIAASCSYNDLPEEVSDHMRGIATMNKQVAAGFAKEWAEGWNTHDLPRVLAHYTEDFQMTSPFIARIAGSEQGGTLIGNESVGNYWSKALVKYPELQFTVHDVLFCVNSLCIYYDSILGLRAVEWLQFNADGLVVAASGSYNRLP